MKSCPRAFLSLLLIQSLVGCASVKTTAINRTDSDIFIGNSNGEPKAHCSARPFNGVPITMRVPTHLDIVIKEKVLLQSEEKGELRRLLPNKRHLLVETKIIHTDKVFTVDAKRPGAGTLNYNMEFGEGDNAQYFKNITSHVEDNTLDAITGALSGVTDSVTGAIGAFSSNAAFGQSANILSTTRTVAWKRFDVDACDFEMQVAEFVELHMNSCNSCQRLNAENVPASQVVLGTELLPPHVVGDYLPVFPAK